MTRFDGKHIVVTGGARGIGRAIVEAFLDEGASVVALDVLSEELDHMRSEQQEPARVETIAVDLSDAEAARSAASEAIQRSGRVDVLVNCAGVMTSGPILEMPLETFDRTIAVNTRAPLITMQTVGAHMADHGGGAIVNVASANAFKNESPEAAYNASKAALVALTKAAAHEWGHNWGRQHAPCGDPANPDQHFPYGGGVTGVYGYDQVSQVVKPPTAHDLMGYCSNDWISDYTYLGVLNYRAQHPLSASQVGRAVQPALLVWGRIERDRVILEPAFRVFTRPSLPPTSGPYRVEGRARDGSSLIRLDFAPAEVADAPDGSRSFAFAVPLSSDRAEGRSAFMLSLTARRVFYSTLFFLNCPKEPCYPNCIWSRWAGRDSQDTVVKRD